MSGGIELGKVVSVYSYHTVSTAGWTINSVKHTSMAERKLPQSLVCQCQTPGWIPLQSYLTCTDADCFPVGVAFGWGVVHISLPGDAKKPLLEE